MTVSVLRQTDRTLISQSIDARWKGLCSAGSVAALSMLLLMILQIVIFTLWPPPTTVTGYFTLFNQNWFLGLLSFDLLYIVDSVLQILIYLALYVVLRRSGESFMLIALVLGIVGIAEYFSSNRAFEMLSLSHQYAAATTEAQQTMFLTAGQVMLETYTGTAFDIYYILNAIVLFILAPIMLRSGLFSKTTAYLGLAAGILMIVPSSAGTLGLYFSLASLVPWAIWLVLIARRLLEFARAL
jgi:hypothetical protein